MTEAASRYPWPPDQVRVAAVVPAKDEAAGVARTVRALRGIALVDQVVVVDDGSTDGTGEVAAAAGATVVRHATNRGKAAAMRTGAAAALSAEPVPGRSTGRLLLFADADLHASAGELSSIIAPVADGGADLAIATLPPQRVAGGGHGFVIRLAREGIRRRTCWIATQPLSGMRCLTPEAYQVAQPLARGWGVETAMTIDLLAAGFGVLEVPCPLEHRVSGRDLTAQLHRARQYADVWLALALRAPLARKVIGSARANRRSGTLG